MLCYQNLAFQNMSSKKLSDIRQNYTKGFLNKQELNPDPIKQFEIWINDAISVEHPEPSAMQLSTVDADGHPHSRVVLLKGIEAQNLLFYTNYNSHKAKDLEQNSKVAVLFFWPLLERQVRVEGTARKVAGEQSDLYFASRPRESQIGAWASPQSAVVSSPAELEQRYKEIENQFKGCNIPRPPHWGGYAIKPVYFEFWQGQPGRMHHRLCYRRHENKWIIEQLAP